MEFCQLIEYNVRNIFLQKSCKKRGKVLYEVKANRLHFSLNFFDSSFFLGYVIKNCVKC